MTGVYCFDSWVRKARQKGIKMCGQFHDEIITPVFNSEYDKNRTESLLRESIQEVNRELPLNRKLDIDVQFGKNYAEIH